MKNRTVEYILSLQDQASLVWNKFEGTINGGVSRLKGAFHSLQGILVSALSVGALSQFINASNEAEQSAMKVHNALRAQGEDTPGMAKMMLDYAMALQRTTIYSHEQVETVEAMLIALTGYTGQGVKPLVKATLDLAAGMNIDVETAARLLARTEEGAEGLKRMGIVIGDTSDEFDRLNAIYAAIEKRFPNLATQLGTTTAGAMIKAKNAAKELGEELGRMLSQTIQPALTGLVPILASILGFIKLAIVDMVRLIVFPLSLLEAGLNKLGLSSSHFFQQMGAGAVKVAETIKGEVADAFKLWGIGLDKTLADSATGMITLEGTTTKAVQKIQKLHGAVNWKDALNSQVNLNMGVEKFYGDLVKVEALTVDIGQVFDEEWTTNLQMVNQAAEATARNIYDFFQGSIQGVSGLFKALCQTIISEVESLLATLAAKAMFAQLLSLIFPSVGFGGFFNQLTGLKIFHAGGIVPKAHDGMYINAPASREFPIVVRGGETVRTEGQEAALKRGNRGGVTNHYWNIQTMDAASFMDYISRPDARRALAAVGDDYSRKGH